MTRTEGLASNSAPRPLEPALGTDGRPPPARDQLAECRRVGPLRYATAIDSVRSAGGAQLDALGRELLELMSQDGGLGSDTTFPLLFALLSAYQSVRGDAHGSASRRKTVAHRLNENTRAFYTDILGMLPALGFEEGELDLDAQTNLVMSSEVFHVEGEHLTRGGLVEAQQFLARHFGFIEEVDQFVLNPTPFMQGLSAKQANATAAQVAQRTAATAVIAEAELEAVNFALGLVAPGSDLVLSVLDKNLQAIAPPGGGAQSSTSDSSRLDRLLAVNAKEFARLVVGRAVGKVADKLLAGAVAEVGGRFEKALVAAFKEGLTGMSKLASSAAYNEVAAGRAPEHPSREEQAKELDNELVDVFVGAVKEAGKQLLTQR